MRHVKKLRCISLEVDIAFLLQQIWQWSNNLWLFRLTLNVKFFGLWRFILKATIKIFLDKYDKEFYEQKTYTINSFCSLNLFRIYIILFWQQFIWIKILICHYKTQILQREAKMVWT
jgi:hypothetical protein